MLLLAALPVAARAQASGAQAFLETLYAPYLAGDGGGQSFDRPGRLFEPVLARAMALDDERARKADEVPALDGDPFVDAQDWQVADLSVRAVETGDRATAAVSFTNFGERKSLAVVLVRTPAGWRIFDITGAGGSLRALYKL